MLETYNLKVPKPSSKSKPVASTTFKVSKPSSKSYSVADLVLVKYFFKSGRERCVEE